jgi:hypothetical protein
MTDLAKDWLRQNPELPEGAPHPNDEITHEVLAWFGFKPKVDSKNDAWVYTIPSELDVLDEDHLISRSRYSWWINYDMVEAAFEPKTAADVDYLIGKIHRWLRVTRKSPTLLLTNSSER